MSSKTIINPSTNTKLDKITYTSINECEIMIQNAKEAQSLWKYETLKNRSQIIYNYRSKLIENKQKLATLIHQENGKTLNEAIAEVDKSIEVCEFACSLPQLCSGETQEVSRGVYCQERLEPQGVVAQITPFNFPMMVAHWTLPISICLGNAVILKPSEKVPLTMIECLKLWQEAGLPKHILQLVHGEKEAVQTLCTHNEIKAVSFVGSTPIAKEVYKLSSQHLKPALCLGGAKNHLIALPDCNIEMTAKDVVASMSGCAGQRCMAASLLIVVGENDTLITRLTEVASELKTGCDIGAIINESSQKRIEEYITNAETQGATIRLDGRQNRPDEGTFVGPTILDHVTPEMPAATDEIFGPVLSIIRVKTVEEAIQIENQSRYGNGASVYTQNGADADFIAEKLEAGMVGINIGVPVPREPFAFGGWHDSKFGVGDITGKSSIHFWTKTKKITKKWSAANKSNWMS